MVQVEGLGLGLGLGLELVQVQVMVRVEGHRVQEWHTLHLQDGVVQSMGV